MFKAGDRVVYSGKGGLLCQLDGSVGVVKDFRTSETTAVEFGLHGEYLCQNRNLSLVPHGPIRTVTRREIVPGVYGRLDVSGTYKGERVTLDWSENGSIHTAVPIVGLSASELREAAHIFNQLAEALEDKP